MKYSIRYKDGRIIGPFDIEQISKLIQQKKVSISDEFKVYSSEVWKIGSDLTEIRELFDPDKTIIHQDETFIANLKDLNFDKQAPEEKQKDITKEIKSETIKEEIVKDPTKVFELEETQVDKTEIKEEDLDKTKINPEYQKYLKDLKEKEQEVEIEEEKEETKIDYEAEQTQIVQLAELGVDLSKAIKEEKDFDKEEQNYKKEQELKKKAIEQKKLKRIKEEKQNVEVQEKKPKTLFFIIGFLLILFVLFDDSEKKTTDNNKIKLTDPDISFPARYDTSDEKLAKDLYRKARITLQKETYLSRLKAIKLLSESLKNQYNDNPAAAFLIFQFSDVLVNSKTPLEDKNTIFKLVQIYNNKAFVDPNYASAISYFYYQIQKYEAAIKTFDKYITLNKTKASSDLFAVRLMALVESGDLVKARVTAQKLSEIKNKDFFTIRSLVKYYKAEDNIDRLSTLLNEGKLKYPELVYFDIESELFNIKQGKFSSLKESLQIIKKKNVENSKIYYSKYLTLKGFYFASIGKVDLAEKNFTKALNINESMELIERLSLLEESGDEKVNLLIQNSKAKKNIHLSKSFLAKGDIKQAMNFALKAKLEAPELFEAKLLLTRLQIKRGYIQDAINDLEEISKDPKLATPLKLKVLFELIDAYTMARNFRKVTALLNVVRNTIEVQDYRYYKAQANLYMAKGERDFAISKLFRAIEANPIDDSNFSLLADLYISYFQYQNAQNMLKRAMDLDPANVEYKITFSKILYEIENSDSAIAYLFNVLEDFKDNPKILSQIGIYYNRSGQLKKFTEIKDKLESLPKKDKSLYIFLKEASKLDEKEDDLIKYAEELSTLEPGDLENRMELAQIYIEKKNYKKAKIHLEAVKERLPTYPKLQYLYAKLNYFIDNIDEAKDLVKKEISSNPTVVDGYLLLADIYLKETKLNKAKEQYIKAARLDSKNINAMFGIAFIALQSDQYDMALDQYEKVKEIAPNNPQVYRLMADAYRKLGQSQLAITNYKQFLELSPNSKYKNKIKTYIETMR